MQFQSSATNLLFVLVINIEEYGMSKLQYLYVCELAGYPVTEAEAEEFHADYMKWQEQTNESECD